MLHNYEALIKLLKSLVASSDWLNDILAGMFLAEILKRNLLG